MERIGTLQARLLTLQVMSFVPCALNMIEKFDKHLNEEHAQACSVFDMNDTYFHEKHSTYLTKLIV